MEQDSLMLLFILRRLLASVPVLLVVSLCSFFFIHTAHGDPAVAMYGNQLERMRPADQERIRENLGLDQPLPVQYGQWLSQALQGEMGTSYITGRPVSQMLAERLPRTIVLNVSALALMVCLAVAVGLASAIRQYSWLDYLATFFSFLFFSIPSFWLALLAILFFSVYLGWLPSAGMASLGNDGDWLDRLRHLLLPVVVLALSHVGAYIRFVRSSMLEVLGKEYIRMAHAKGLSPRRVHYLHAFRNALVPVITYGGLSFSSLVGGGYLVETVFAYPGLGQLSIQAASMRDYPLLMGTILLTGCFVVAGNLLADIACAWVDPRLTVEGLRKKVGGIG